VRLVILDTNVPIAANGDSTVSPECAERCIDAILRITQGEERLAVDDANLIVGEYGHKLVAGQQGVGHEFLKWVYNTQWDTTYCERVTITPGAGSADGCDFEEFPKHEALASFDRSDRKFVAVATAHPKRPPILEAADAKWVGWAKALAEAGVTVEFLCEHEIKVKYDDNFAPPPVRARRKGASGG
jgi:hypothetical protein